jgi:hypothetical protein
LDREVIGGFAAPCDEGKINLSVMNWVKHDSHFSFSDDFNSRLALLGTLMEKSRRFARCGGWREDLGVPLVLGLVRY